MTMHIKYDHICPQCEAMYIPYDSDVPCPMCGTIEDERFDFIPQAAASALVNLKIGGKYIPGAWWASSYADHVLQIVFQFLEAHRLADADSEFSSVARECVDRGVWGNQEYAKEHMFAIACRVYEEIQRRQSAHGGDSPDIKDSGEPGMKPGEV